jgi:phage shock protein PspC (stress-responsive transcriptional regulator)
MLHHMATILVWYGGHFESKMATKIQKSSDLGKIWFPSRSCSCELIIFIIFGIGSHGVGWCPLLLCNGNSSYYYITPTAVRWCIVILHFFFTIIIITSPRLLSGDVLLFYYYSYYITPTVVRWCIVILRFFFTIIIIIILITSPRLLSGDVLLFYYYYYSTHFCPLDFSEMPWSNFMKPCRNIICHVKLCC